MVTPRLLNLIAETFNILSVTVWLMDERQQRLVMAASTSTLALQDANKSPDMPESQQVLQGLAERREPFNLEKLMEPWAEALRRAKRGPTSRMEGSGFACP